jgi:P-type E1-E2 ATPase
MLVLDIPGFKTLSLQHLVLDYNGTMACDGELLAGVRERLTALADTLRLHILTGDTFGKARSQLVGLPCALSVLPAQGQDQRKLQYIRALGPERTACIGNGRNDRLMLREAGLGIVVLQAEGAAVQAAVAADIVVPDILTALDLLLHPLRLVATLRA